MIWIGIDIGAKGAFATINDTGELSYEPVPLIAKEIDVQSICKYLLQFKDIKCHVVMENLHSVFGAGAKSNYQFGRVNGLIEGILIAYEIPFTKIQAKKWQTEMFEGVSLIYKPSKPNEKTKKIDTKATALIAAKRLFPKESFLATERSKVPHDGIVDSVLMALYCKRHFK